MTGLDIEKEHIIEMACLVTDTELNVIAEVIINIEIVTLTTSNHQ